ncbi:hypothetical protein PIB30_106306 [Stylosanthes scabra]|uniref:Putative plant transposon protein domain-containing protein n=1 Tax=Stylosanthes scabra TaxID=79078 RepID=A0ABU6ZXG9_9FABA|nr:hypothetical protein [Stylosanthes scabra]
MTPKKQFDLQEGQYPQVAKQISLRGWRRISKPRTKISKDLVHEFYANAVRTEEELASGEDYAYTSYVRGKEMDFSTAKIREVLRIRHMTLGAETDFKTRQMEDQRLDEVIRDICMPGARWKMSSSQPPHPIQLRREDLTPVARGWAEFIIHSMIPTGNKSEITVARAVLIHSIIKGHDVRVEELIANNIAVLAERVQGRNKLCFPSTIYRLYKEAGVPMGEFKDGEKIQIAKPITAKVMTTIRGRIINQPQNQPMEEDEDDYDAENQFANHDQDQEMHFEAPGTEEDHHQYNDQPNFEDYESNFQQYIEDQQQGFQFLNEELASLKIRQEQFFENMQKAQSQYLEELKSLRNKQDEMVNQQNNFYRQIKREQEKTIKEIEEVKKFQVNHTLMGAHRTPVEKLEERVHETINEIIEMKKQIREWTRNASSREGYCCWAHQQANPNLVEIPPHKIHEFLHNNVANKKDPYYGALKSEVQQGESSQAADQPITNPPNP